jgi:hypothetical protein
MKFYIGLVGFGQSGKDTGLKSLNKFLSVANERFHRIAFADPLKKDMALAENRAIKILKRKGVPQDKWKQMIRPIHVFYGSSFIRELDEDEWVIDAFSRAQRAKDNLICFTDVRNINEAVEIIENGGVLLNIEKPGQGPKSDVEKESIEALRKKFLKTQKMVTIVNDSTVEELGEKMFYNKTFQGFWKGYKFWKDEE